MKMTCDFCREYLSDTDETRNTAYLIFRKQAIMKHGKKVRRVMTTGMMIGTVTGIPETVGILTVVTGTVTGKK